MSPMLITEMPRVSPTCTRSPPPSPLVICTLPPQVPCVISLSPCSLASAVRHHQQVFLRQHPGRSLYP